MTCRLKPVDTIVYNREKDVPRTTGKWFGELLTIKPWFSEVVPNVIPVSTLEHTSVLIGLPVSSHSERGVAVRIRLGLDIYLGLYQYGHLPALAGRAVSQERNRLQARDCQACC